MALDEDDRRSSRKRRAILDAAVTTFLERGYPGTSMDEIIAECGMSAGAVYLYFPGGKDSLIAAATRTSLEALAKDMAPLFLRGSDLRPDEFVLETGALIGTVASIVCSGMN